MHVETQFTLRSARPPPQRTTTVRECRQPKLYPPCYEVNPHSDPNRKADVLIRSVEKKDASLDFLQTKLEEKNQIVKMT